MLTCNAFTLTIISSPMTWRVETPSRTIARNVNTKANGANTEKRERSSSRDLVQHSRRRFNYVNKLMILVGKCTAGEKILTYSP